MTFDGDCPRAAFGQARAHSLTIATRALSSGGTLFDQGNRRRDVVGLKSTDF